MNMLTDLYALIPMRKCETLMFQVASLCMHATASEDVYLPNIDGWYGALKSFLFFCA